MAERHDQLYLTLPSNSSMKYHPNNTVANFTTQLSHPIQLSDGEWEVGLVEVHYPCSMPTVVEGKNHLSFDVKQADGTIKQHEVVVPSGEYSSVKQLVDVINTDPTVAAYARFSVDEITGIVSIHFLSEEVPMTLLSRNLLVNLGFQQSGEPMKIQTEEERRLRVNRGIRPGNLLVTVPSQMYLYCDLVEPQIVGDTVAPLLQIVNLNLSSCKYGTHQVAQFNSPHYVPVLKNRFEQVEIDLRDSTGSKLPFQFGTSCVKLHLRKTDRWR